MKTELLRNFKHPFYWGVLTAGLIVRGGLACMDRLYRAARFWELSAEFWSKTGSMTTGVLVLLVLLRPLALDRETGAQPVILSSARGRGWLLLRRLTAGAVAAVMGILILAAGNGLITLLLGRGLPRPADLPALRPVLPAMVGAAGFFLLAACLCDAVQNQPAAMCICGIPFTLSYFINSEFVRRFGRFGLFWFIRYGFFTELLRGRWPEDLPGFWLGWYPALLLGILALAIWKRKGRKAL